MRYLQLLQQNGIRICKMRESLKDVKQTFIYLIIKILSIENGENLLYITRLCLSLWLIWFLCFRFVALTELGAFMRTEVLCISVLRVGSGSRVKLASCKSALTTHPTPMVSSADRSKAVVPVLVLLFVALWFILRGDLFYILPCVILCFSVLLALRLPRLGKRELILELFVRLFDLRLFGFVCFLFLLVSGKGCGLWLWNSLDFSLTPLF